MSDNEADNEQPSVEELTGRVQALEDENEKFRTSLESLRARIETLEAGGGAPDEESKSVSPKKKHPKKGGGSKKKHDSKKKDGGSKKKTKKPKEEKLSDGKRRERKAKEFYHACGSKIYVDVPPPFKNGTKSKAPAKTLGLHYAYGYNGGISNNLISVEKGDQTCLAYCLAGVAVITNPADLSDQQHFRGHSEDVICIDKSPTEALIATGQRDPKDTKDDPDKEDKPYVCIWNSDTMEETGRIRNHFEREVCSVGFTCDGKYLFCIGGDDSHIGGLWEVGNLKKKPLFSQMTSKAEVYGQAHAPEMVGDAYRWVTFGEKTFKWWEIVPKGDKDDQKVITPQTLSQTKISQKSYCCATWAPDGDLLMGCHSGHIYVFGKDNHNLKKFWDTGKHPINTINCVGEGYRAIDSKGKAYFYSLADHSEEKDAVAIGSLAKSSCDAGGITYIGTRKGGIISTDWEGKKEVLVEGHTKEIWCLATHPSQPWVCIGSNDKVLRVWNYDTKKIAFSATSKHGFTSADFNRQGTELAVGCMNGSLCVYDCETEPWGSCKFDEKVCKENISAVAFSRDGDKIIVGSWDQTVRIFKKSKGEWKKKPTTLKGHTSSITHICMSEDGKFAQSNSKDCDTLYWNVAEKKRMVELPPNDTVWDRWNCIFGWPVQGLFHEAGDITDVNCCEVSGDNEINDDNGNKMVASGDDTGHVSIFKYPILEAKPSSKSVHQYLAHSAHVTNVRWSEDDKWLFSSGGGDLAVFQWEVEGGAE